ncbi:hypothetical protein BJ170DRAFT_286568 [Xylariales sp. AK1849]|nr:hypothetical protein BJ170DRAFT_286568 [Xylariales sp. AK1849]
MSAEGVYTSLSRLKQSSHKHKDHSLRLSTAVGECNGYMGTKQWYKVDSKPLGPMLPRLEISALLPGVDISAPTPLKQPKVGDGAAPGLTRIQCPQSFTCQLTYILNASALRVNVSQQFMALALEIWQAGNWQPSSQSPTLAGSSATASNTTGLKRDNSSLTDVDSAFGPQPSAPSVKRQRAKGQLSSGGFACHYYKRYPSAHISCLGYHFKKLKDVNQHLNRCHRGPAIHCPTCGTEFATEPAMNGHIVSRTCQRRDFIFQGMTRGQVQDIAKILNSRRSDEDRWFMVWDVLFPGHLRPDSPYRTDLANEVTLDLQKFYQSEECQPILWSILDDDRTGQTPADIIRSLDRVVEAFRARAEEERRSTLEISPRAEGVVDIIRERFSPPTFIPEHEDFALDQLPLLEMPYHQPPGSTRHWPRAPRNMNRANHYYLPEPARPAADESTPSAFEFSDYVNDNDNDVGSQTHDDEGNG